MDATISAEEVYRRSPYFGITAAVTGETRLVVFSVKPARPPGAPLEVLWKYSRTPTASRLPLGKIYPDSGFQSSGPEDAKTETFRRWLYYLIATNQIGPDTK